MTATKWQEYGVTYPAALVAKARQIHDSDGPGRLPWEAQTDAIKAGYIIRAHNHFQEET